VRVRGDRSARWWGLKVAALLCALALAGLMVSLSPPR